MMSAKKKVWGITKRTLKMIMECAKDSHPREFAAGMRAMDGLISELILVPGTISGNTSALLRLHHLPIDYTMVGIVHSHPSSNTSPSERDLNMFARYGRVHIIAGWPYDERSWSVYDHGGNRMSLEVVP